MTSASKENSSVSLLSVSFSQSISLFVYRWTAVRLKTTKAVDPCFPSRPLPRIFGLSTNKEQAIQSSDRLTKEVEVGLKTMPKKKKSEKKTRKSRKAQEREATGVKP